MNRKYKDATLLNEFHEMSMQASENANLDTSDQELRGAGAPPLDNRDGRESEEEEIDTGEIRM